MTFIIVRVKVSSKLNKNINIQTRQVLKQNGEKQRFEFTTKVLGNKNLQILYVTKNKLKMLKLMLRLKLKIAV